MANPVRALKKTDKLSSRQKMIVRKVRKAKLPIKVYQRGRGISVHDPFLDFRRKAKLGSIGNTKRTPQSMDTQIQRKIRLGKFKLKPKGSRKVASKSARKFLLP